MLLDDRSPEMSRGQAKEKVNEVLLRPLDEEEAREFDRENWGMNAEANDSFWADKTYGE